MGDPSDKEASDSDEKEEKEIVESTEAAHEDELQESKNVEVEAKIEEEKPQVDTSKFINSFSEAVDVAPKTVPLPTLVFNDKTMELAPKDDEEENINVDEGHDVDNAKNDTHDVEEASAVNEVVDNDVLETELSKWDKDDFYEKTNQLSETSQKELKKVSSMEDIPGPQTILKRALSNMEKDKHQRDKKRRSLESEDEIKEKKRRSLEAEEDDKEVEEPHSRKKKKKKRDLDIPEKTLKKLLKKNLLKKKALEKLLEDGTTKKKKKKRKSADFSDADQDNSDKNQDSEAETDTRVVRRVKSGSQDRLEENKSSSRKRHESDENREVKSSREGHLQIRVDNNSSKPKKILTSAIQANLMKISNGRGNPSPLRKSIKDRLGPVGDKSSSSRERDIRSSRERDLKKDTIKDRLGRKVAERDSKRSDNDSKLS